MLPAPEDLWIAGTRPGMTAAPYIGGATPRPTLTRPASSDPSGSFFAAEMKILAPAFSSFVSPGT